MQIKYYYVSRCILKQSRWALDPRSGIRDTIHLEWKSEKLQNIVITFNGVLCVFCIFYSGNESFVETVPFRTSD